MNILKSMLLFSLLSTNHLLANSDVEEIELQNSAEELTQELGLEPAETQDESASAGIVVEIDQKTADELLKRTNFKRQFLNNAIPRVQVFGGVGVSGHSVLHAGAGIENKYLSIDGAVSIGFKANKINSPSLIDCSNPDFNCYRDSYNPYLSTKEGYVTDEGIIEYEPTPTRIGTYEMNEIQHTSLLSLSVGVRAKLTRFVEAGFRYMNTFSYNSAWSETGSKYVAEYANDDNSDIVDRVQASRLLGNNQSEYQQSLRKIGYDIRVLSPNLIKEEQRKKGSIYLYMQIQGMKKETIAPSFVGAGVKYTLPNLRKKK